MPTVTGRWAAMHGHARPRTGIRTRNPTMPPSAIPRRGWRNLVTENQEMKGVMKTDWRLPQKPPHLCSLPDLVAYIKAGTSSHSLNCPGHHSWLLDAADGQVVIAPRVLKGAQTSAQSQPLLGSALGGSCCPTPGFPVLSLGALGPSDQLQKRENG